METESPKDVDMGAQEKKKEKNFKPDIFHSEGEPPPTHIKKSKDFLFEILSGTVQGAVIMTTTRSFPDRLPSPHLSTHIRKSSCFCFEIISSGIVLESSLLPVSQVSPSPHVLPPPRKETPKFLFRDHVVLALVCHYVLHCPRVESS